MSAPTTGGRTFTLPRGASAGTLITERGASSDEPLVLINRSQDSAWIGSDSGVGPSSGVPLEGGTSLPWTSSGPLYAAADPAAAGPVQLVASSAVDGWTPSPYALAGAVAAKMLATGVPNVLTTATVANGRLTANASQTYDVSGYASVVVWAVASIKYEFQDGTDVDSDIIQAGVPTRLAVVGTTLKITDASGGANTFYVIGSNRPALARFDARRNAGQGDRWSLTAPGSVLSGADLPMTQLDSTVVLQGRAMLSVTMDPGTKGRLVLSSPLGNTWLADSAEAVVSSSSSLVVVREIALPAGSSYSLVFHSTAAQTLGNVIAMLIPSEL